MLTVDGEQTTPSLTTFGKQNSVMECRVFKLEVFDFNEQNVVENPTVFSTPQLPVSKNSIPQQEDINKYPSLKGIHLPKISTPIGLLIGNDVPKYFTCTWSCKIEISSLLATIFSIISLCSAFNSTTGNKAKLHPTLLTAILLRNFWRDSKKRCMHCNYNSVEIARISYKINDIPSINLPRKLIEEYWFLAPMLRLAIPSASLNFFFCKRYAAILPLYGPNN